MMRWGRRPAAGGRGRYAAAVLLCAASAWAGGGGVAPSEADAPAAAQAATRAATQLADQAAVAASRSPAIATSEADRSWQSARADYVLQCAGCHRVDGRGSNPHGIPDFRQSVGAFVHVPEGREYLIRVPGAAHSQLSNAELAAVLNWVLTQFSAAQLPADFIPYTEAEVGRARPNRYDDVVPVRHALARRLSAMGFALSDYSYGSDRKP